MKRIPAFSAFLNVVTAKRFCGKHGRWKRLVLFGGRGRDADSTSGRLLPCGSSWEEVGKT